MTKITEVCLNPNERQMRINPLWNAASPLEDCEIDQSFGEKELAEAKREADVSSDIQHMANMIKLATFSGDSVLLKNALAQNKFGSEMKKSGDMYLVDLEDPSRKVLVYNANLMAVANVVPQEAFNHAIERDLLEQIHKVNSIKSRWERAEAKELADVVSEKEHYERMLFSGDDTFIRHALKGLGELRQKNSQANTPDNELERLFEVIFDPDSKVNNKIMEFLIQHADFAAPEDLESFRGDRYLIAFKVFTREKSDVKHIDTSLGEIDEGLYLACAQKAELDASLGKTIEIYIFRYDGQDFSEEEKGFLRLYSMEYGKYLLGKLAKSGEYENKKTRVSFVFQSIDPLQESEQVRVST